MGKYQEQHQTDVLTIEKELSTSNLVVYNDEVNTFDWVIETLIEVCKHTYEQAEQCSIFIHTQGKYAVKEGSLKKLRPMRDAIIERGIQATIE
ncbi:MAG: ATP-dependent Clp protease adaptor ClpS [Chitinophagales bacterium]|nr:ATP-dependent Clp protease adaptor ClpS [Chitinophagales bacterium]